MKTVTMQEVAGAAGVSRTTVSFVLNNTPNKAIPQATRKRVLEAARKLGYAHRARQQNVISLVVRRPTEQLAQAAFLIEVMRGLSAVIEPHGYHIRLCEIPTNQTFDYADWIRNNSFAAVALHNILMRDIDRLQKLAQEDIPLVSIGQSGVPNIYYVGVDNVMGAYQAVNHLLELGHRRIAMILFDSLEYIVAAYRAAGYKQALAKHNVPYDESLVRCADFTSESGYRAMIDLLESLPEPPGAVFTSGDVIAAGAMKAIHDWGLRIPEDISIASFDNVPFAPFLTPPLTTVNRPAYEIGHGVGEMLITMLKEKRRVEQSIILETELIIRESTAPYNPDRIQGNGRGRL